MSTEKIIQLSITELTLNKRFAQKPGREDFNLIKFTLVHPRAGVPEVIALRQIPKEDDDFAPYLRDHAGGILFKEKIHGETYLIVEILAVDNESKLGKFLKVAFASAATAGLGLATGGASNAILAAFINGAGSHILGELKETKADSAIMGRAVFPIKSATLVDGTTQENLTAPIPVTRTVYTQPRGPRRRQPTASEEVVLSTNEKNGSVTIHFKTLV